MWSYALRRILFAFPTVLGVMLAVFFVARIIPSDPAEAMLGAVAGEEEIEALRHQLGLDRSVIVQLAFTFRDYATGSMGRSYQTQRLVSREILLRFPHTAALAIAGMLIATVVGVVLGVAGATRRGSFLDIIVLTMSTIGLAAPSFWVGLLLMMVFSVKAL